MKQARVYDWHGIKQGLRALYESHPQVYDTAILVGGGACWFYRVQLSTAKDADFHERHYSVDEQADWLSKDADFTNIEPELLPREAGNFPIGCVQFGTRVCPEEYYENARTVSLRYLDGFKFQLLVADALDLHKEKTALMHRVSRVQDPLHVEILEEFLRYDLCALAEQLVREGDEKLRSWMDLSHRLRNYAPELLTHPALLRRLAEPALAYPEIARFVENEIKPRQIPTA